MAEQEVIVEPPQIRQPRRPAIDLLSDVSRPWYAREGIRLYKAALKGDWETAKPIIDVHRDWLRAKITRRGDTLLHVAAAANHTNFVENLVNLEVRLQPYGRCRLDLQNNVGNTALCLAATSGTVPIAMLMVSADPELPVIRSNSRLTPLQIAALLGHRDMVLYLWPLTHRDLGEQDRADVLISTINTDLYDVALQILDDYPDLAIHRGADQQTPLHVLARKSNKSVGNHPSIWRRCCNILSCNRRGYPGSNISQRLKLIDRICERVGELTQSQMLELISGPFRLLFVAVQEGDVELLTRLIRCHPDLIWEVDDNQQSIFHAAIKHRQQKIFQLIYEIGAIKDILAMYPDKDQNSMLHLAAMLPTSDKLNCISGAALQMQREMWWFKTIEDLVQPQIAEGENKDEKIARDLFIEQHENLREKGEKWMANTASSCSVVATLIASVLFGAMLKVPESIEHGAWFWLFVMADSLSLISSTASILMFLSILTSRYLQKDFLRSLPLKLMFGLALLFFSIITMMVAFTAIFSITVPRNKIRLTWILIAVLAAIPIAVFFKLMLPLFLDIRRSTNRCKAYSKAKDQLFGY